MTLFQNDFTYTFLKIETIALKVEEMFNHTTMFVIDSTSTLFQVCMYGCADWGLPLWGRGLPMVRARGSLTVIPRLTWRRGNRERINKTFSIFNTSSLDTSIGLMDLDVQSKENIPCEIYFLKLVENASWYNKFHHHAQDEHLVFSVLLALFQIMFLIHFFMFHHFCWKWPNHLIT